MEEMGSCSTSEGPVVQQQLLKYFLEFNSDATENQQQAKT